MADHPVFGLFHRVPSRSTGRHVFDFIGAATGVAYRQQFARRVIAPGTEVMPNYPPKNEHYLDWIGLLRAVDRARGTFRMAELGAGYAPWLVRGALAARQRPGLDSVELLAVEADPVRYGWISEHFADNGLDPAAHTILHGAVAGAPGELQFPAVDEPDVDYGAGLASAASSARTITVPAYVLSDLLQRFSGPIDFLHVDMQGAEYDVLPPMMAAMSDSANPVKSIMVGTHFSDARHDGLLAGFRAAGWREVIAFGRNRTHPTPWGEIAINDGFLLFDNPMYD